MKRPVLLDAKGKADLNRGVLNLSNVAGEQGTALTLQLLLPANRKIGKVTVNGREFNSFSQEDELVSLAVAFAGTRFEHCQQVGEYDANFAGTIFRGEFTVPQNVFAQLANRRKAWPVPYTQEELLATWGGSDRLLLLVHIADPDDKWIVGLKLNDQDIQVNRAYSDVFPWGRERTFTGFYADVSSLKPDTRYEAEVTLPARLQPGQFQGLFFQNVETELTTELAP